MPVNPIQDHVERALKALPAQHKRDGWRKLMRVLVGIRGAWADGEPLWAVPGTTKGTIVVHEDELDTYFGGGGASTIIGGGSNDFEIDGRTLRISTLGSPPAFILTPEEVDTAIESRVLLPVDHDEFDDQIVAEVTAALSGAAWGIQELEGIFFELFGLRPLPVAAGEQLDRWGDLLNHTRDGRSDADYRNSLFLARRANGTRSTIPEILEAGQEQPETIFIQLQEALEAYYQVYLHGTAWDAARRRLLRQMHALGVGSDITSVGGTLPFVFGPDGGWHVIETVAANKYTIAGDVSGFFATNDAVRVYDFDGETVVHTTTVTGVTFVGPDTEIDVDDDGGVTPGITILENVERGIQDEDGGAFEDAYEIVGFTGPATFRVDGDASAEFVGGGTGAGELIEVTGSTGDDGVYRVTGVSFGAGETSLAVTPVPPSGSGDGQLQHAPPEYDPALDGVRSPHGEFADVFVD